ncbi:hypothetical protein [Arthrobacter sp. NPDC093139]|uniref:hypothetical protein n=1 Tax=Arthrobacter sp. NPDC093139 TaxID=3363945 RepID=UPI00381F3DE4
MSGALNLFRTAQLLALGFTSKPAVLNSVALAIGVNAGLCRAAALAVALSSANQPQRKL